MMVPRPLLPAVSAVLLLAFAACVTNPATGRREFSLMSEAVYLGKPILAVPLRGQFEQLMNARYLQRLGYGLCAPRVTKASLSDFIERMPEFEHALSRYEQVGNSVALRTIEQQATQRKQQVTNVIIKAPMGGIEPRELAPPSWFYFWRTNDGNRRTAQAGQPALPSADGMRTAWPDLRSGTD
jgi:hypothetical protein